MNYPQYIQLFSVGILWISLHCSGMCGPIVIGLDLGGTISGGKTRRSHLGRAAFNMTFYQLGRSVTYAALGAMAGLGGNVFQQVLFKIAKSAGILMAASFVFFGIVRLSGLRFFSETGPGTGAMGRILGKLAKYSGKSSGVWRRFTLGLVLGLMPCMITFWVLGLAASTQSPLHGALLMVCLVWMTSFVIYGFGITPAFASTRFAPWRERLPSVLLICSGLWLGLVAAAANGWIEHAGFGFAIGGHGYAIMFW
jgi:uncharacterized protein